MVDGLSTRSYGLHETVLNLNRTQCDTRCEHVPF